MKKKINNIQKENQSLININNSIDNSNKSIDLLSLYEQKWSAKITKIKKIQKIKEQVKNGTYKVDSKELAKAMLYLN